jgi:hypothetical protein
MKLEKEVQIVRDEIDLKVESLKAELDKIRDALFDEINYQHLDILE